MYKDNGKSYNINEVKNLKFCKQYLKHRAQINSALKKDYFQNHNSYYSLTMKGQSFGKNFLSNQQRKNQNIDEETMNYTICKNNKYSKPKWEIDINQTNKHELNQFLANKIIKSINEKEDKKIIEEIDNCEADINKETEKQALVKIRMGHSKLRNRILNHKKKCEICGIKNNKLLIISHIKPWSKSEDHEKLDESNILLLCSMHDALFDKGLISFDDNGKILISSELDENEQALVNVNEDSYIKITSDRQIEFLKYHRENIFIK